MIGGMPHCKQESLPLLSSGTPVQRAAAIVTGPRQVYATPCYHYRWHLCLPGIQCQILPSQAPATPFLQQKLLTTGALMPLPRANSKAAWKSWCLGTQWPYSTNLRSSSSLVGTHGSLHKARQKSAQGEQNCSAWAISLRRAIQCLHCAL